MSKDALNQLRELLRTAVTRAGGDLTGEALAMLAAHVKTRVWLIVGVVPDLAELGAPARSRDQGRVTWARDLLRDMLPGFEAVDRIARGLVDLLDDEIRTYQEKSHRRETLSPSDRAPSARPLRDEPPNED
jgi:hypothetical protein